MKDAVMKAIVVAAVGISAIVALAAYGQVDTTASRNESKWKAVVEDDLDRLQGGLSVVSCAGARFRLDLCGWIPTAQAIASHPTQQKHREIKYVEYLESA